MTLKEWVATPEGMDEFVKWRRLPATRKFLGGVALKNRAKKLDSPNGELAIQQLAFLAGRDSVLQDLIELDAMVGSEMLPPEDYSMTSVLTESFGYSKDDVAKGMKEFRDNG